MFLSTTLVPRCGTTSAEAGLEDPILKQLPPTVESLLLLLKQEVASTPLTDPLWDLVDSCLPWLGRLLLLSLSPLSSASAELLTRRITVHWKWLRKRLSPIFKEAGCGKLQKLLDSYSTVVARHPAFCSRSCSRLVRTLGAAPPPLCTLEQCQALATLTALDSSPLLAQPLHRARFLCLHGTKVSALLLSLPSSPLEEVARGLLKLLTSYSDMVEQEQEVQATGGVSNVQQVPAENYLALQTLALREELQEVCGGQDQEVQGLRLRVVRRMGDRSHSYRGQEMALQVLESQARPALRVALALEHDPILNVLKVADVKKEGGEGGLLHLLTKLVSAKEGGRGTAISCAQEKTEQLEQLQELLRGVNCSQEHMQEQEGVQELEQLVAAMITSSRLAKSSPGLLEGLQLLISSQEMQELLPLLTTLEQEISRRQEQETGMLTPYRLELLLNCLKLQLYSRLGALDPAETRAMKLKYVGESLEETKGRIHVRSTFHEHLGGAPHPHLLLLKARFASLEKEGRRRAGLAAVRGESADFVALSSSVAHFSGTLGSSSTVLGLMAGLQQDLEQEQGSAVAEAQLWVKSTTVYLRSLLQHSSFPDLTTPIAEAAARLLTGVRRALEVVQQEGARRRLPGLERSLANLASPAPAADRPLAESAAWLLSPQVAELLEGAGTGVGGLLPLRSALLTLALSQHCQKGEILSGMVTRVLELWRAEESAREDRKAEEEALYRTKTYADEEEDEVQERNDYVKLFPTFSELFADLIEDDNFGGSVQKDQKEKKEEVPKDSSYIYEVVGLLQRLVLTQSANITELEQEKEADFLTRSLSLY